MGTAGKENVGVECIQDITKRVLEVKHCGDQAG